MIPKTLQMIPKTLLRLLMLTLCATMLMPSKSEGDEAHRHISVYEAYYPHTHSESEDGEAHNISNHIKQGKDKFSAGDYAGAIADFDTAAKITPRHPEAYYYRASAKFEWGKDQQETEALEHAKANYRAAIEDYTQVITLDPEIPGSYVFGGSVHLRLGDWAEGEANWEQAKHHYAAVNKMGRELTDLDSENSSGWRTRGIANLKLGILAIDQGDVEHAQIYYENSLDAYHQTIALNPENPMASVTRGNVYIHLGILEMTRANFHEAKRYYQSAIQDSRQATLAAPTMEYALFLSVPLNAAYIKLGEAEVALGNIEEGQSHYELATDSLGAITFLGQGGIAAADAYEYLAVGKLKFGESDARLGNVQQAEEHYREALEACRQLIAFVPKKAKAFYIQGLVKAALSDYTGAISDFERVITLQPDHALAYYARGLAKQALGQHDTAASDFAKARGLNAYVDKLYPFTNGGEE